MVIKELFEIEDSAKKLAFVKANKAELISSKKSMIKRCDSIVATPKPFKSTEANKAETNENGIYRIVGNSIGFMDSHMDVSISGSFDKSVNERGNRIPMLINHDYNPKSIYAANRGVMVERVNIRELGYDKDGMTEAVMAKIEPKYDAKMRELYADGQIKEHSVGIRYVKLELAINDPEEEREYANWLKYYPDVINREVADEAGFFFAVKEQRLEEISAVVFGSNPYTPTLYEPKNTTQEPHKSTQEKPIESETGKVLNLLEIYNSL